MPDSSAAIDWRRYSFSICNFVCTALTAIAAGNNGFRITIFDSRTRGDNLKPRLERVVVAKAKTQQFSAIFIFRPVLP